MTLTPEEQASALHYLQAVADFAKFAVLQETPATEEDAREVLHKYLKLHFPEADQLARLQRAALYFGTIATRTAYIIGLEARQRVDELAGEAG